MTNYRLVVAAVSIPTITAIFGLLWLWERKKKQETPRNDDSSSVSEGLTKNHVSGSCSSIYEALSEPLNNGNAVISGNDEDNSYDDEDCRIKRPLLGQDWIDKINASFLSDFEDINNPESNLHAVSKNFASFADQDSGAFTTSISRVNDQSTPPKTELSEAGSESLLPCRQKLEEKPGLEDDEEEIDYGEAEIVENKGKEEEEKDLIPEVKNELSKSNSNYQSKPPIDVISAIISGGQFNESLLKADWAQGKLMASSPNLTDAESIFDKRLNPEETEILLISSIETEVGSTFVEEVLAEESDDQPELPEAKSNGFGSGESNTSLATSDRNEEEVEVDIQVEADLIPVIKNGHSKEESLLSEEGSELEKTNPVMDSLNGNYGDSEPSGESTPELENGTCSELVTSDEYVSGSEKPNQSIDGCDLETPILATSEKLLSSSQGKRVFNETSGSITPPETDSDTYLSSKEIMSETMESDQTDDSSLTPNPGNQSEDEENGSASPLSSTSKKEQEMFFRNGQTSTDDQHLDIVAPNSELYQKTASSPKLDNSSKSVLPEKTDNLNQQEHYTESSPESKSLILPVENIAERDTIVVEKSEKELATEKSNEVVTSQGLGNDLESESLRTLNGNTSVDTLAASQQPRQEVTQTLDQTPLCNDSTHLNQNQNNNRAYSEDQGSHQSESKAVIQAKLGPEKTSPPKEQGKPDSVLSSNCDAKNSKLPDINKMAVKTKSSTLYEFYFPSDLCGRLIGRQGKNIIHIKERSGASVSLQPSPYTPNHQICSIEGTQEEIDEALKCISVKFPSSIYPNVDLTAITDTTQLASSPVVVPDLIQVTSNLILSLPPDGVSIDILVASIVDGGHLFIQLPTHPTYAALDRLNQFMNRCYSQPGMVPQLPRPLAVGVICAAPVMEGWYRAVVVAVSEETDECEIKFVDYGGFSQVPGNLLRQIRSDFMTLPFQAIEAYLANITPLQSENYFSDRAVEILQELTENGLLQAQVVSRAEDGTPYVHIYQINGNKVTFVNRELVNRGAVRWIEVL